MKKQATIFSTGAVGYSLIEILARGYTHWTMTILGGLCLLGLYSLAAVSYTHLDVYKRQLINRPMANVAAPNRKNASRQP